jgi:FMN phosphatase YigB (HAD superfamily)
MINAILFDFGQTLVDSSQGFRQAENRAQEIIYQDLELKSWSEFKEYYRSTRKVFQDNSNFSRSALWETVYDHFQREVDQEALSHLESDYWRTVEKFTLPFPETGYVLGELTKSFLLGMITNTQGQVNTNDHRLTRYPTIEKYFTEIIIAGSDGIPPKPHQEPFQLCLSGLGLHPSEAIFVGDDWYKDIIGAKDTGLLPIWLKHYTVKRNWPEVETNVPVIFRLEELLSLETLGLDQVS